MQMVLMSNTYLLMPAHAKLLTTHHAAVEAMAA